MLSVVLVPKDVLRLKFALKNTRRQAGIEVKLLPKRGAKAFVKELRKRISSQNFGSEEYTALNPRYAAWKAKNGKKGGFWEMDRTLYDNLVAYRDSAGDWVGGINPSAMTDDGIPVSFYARKLEEGTEYIPARPLFKPTYFDFKYQIWPGMVEKSAENIRKRYK